LEFGIKNNVHIISDEIYSLSKFPESKFVSTAKVMRDLNTESDQSRYLGK